MRLIVRGNDGRLVTVHAHVAAPTLLGGCLSKIGEQEAPSTRAGPGVTQHVLEPSLGPRPSPLYGFVVHRELRGSRVLERELKCSSGRLPSQKPSLLQVLQSPVYPLPGEVHAAGRCRQIQPPPFRKRIGMHDSEKRVKKLSERPIRHLTRPLPEGPSRLLKPDEAVFITLREHAPGPLTSNEINRGPHLRSGILGHLQHGLQVHNQRAVRLAANGHLADTADRVVDRLHFLRRGVRSLDKCFLRLRIRLPKEKHRVGTRSVPTRPTRLLVVGFQRGRQVGMQDEPHVGLVDPHAECIRRDHDAGPARRPGLLTLFPFLRGESPVISLHAHAVGLEAARPPLNASAGGGIDDSGPLHGLHHVLHLRPLVVGAKDGPHKIRPIEPADDFLGVLQVQQLHHIAPDRRRRRGRDRQRRRVVEEGPRLRNLQVVGPKVVPPFTHTVRLVHGQQRDGQALGPRPKDLGR